MKLLKVKNNVSNFISYLEELDEVILKKINDTNSVDSEIIDDLINERGKIINILCALKDKSPLEKSELERIKKILLNNKTIERTLSKKKNHYLYELKNFKKTRRLSQTYTQSSVENIEKNES